MRRGDLRLAGGRVVETALESEPSLDAFAGERVVPLEDHLAFPGLINAHDHLGLDLLPRLGHPPYDNSYEWAREIYDPQSSPIREMLTVPEVDRYLWGGYRNLFAGVTTVAHHDPYHRCMDPGRRRPFPVRVVKRYGWAHSLAYADDVAGAHRRSVRRARQPFMIHAAEGIDEPARAEIAQLERLDVLRRDDVVDPWSRGRLLAHRAPLAASCQSRLVPELERIPLRRHRSGG